MPCDLCIVTAYATRNGNCRRDATTFFSTSILNRCREIETVLPESNLTVIDVSPIPRTVPQLPVILLGLLVA